jgi:hypothetical protein
VSLSCLTLHLTSHQVLIFDCGLYYLVFKLDRGLFGANPIFSHFLKCTEEKKKKRRTLAALVSDEPEVESGRAHSCELATSGVKSAQRKKENRQRNG